MSSRRFLLGLALVLAGGPSLPPLASADNPADRPKKAALRLEVEVERGKELDRLTVYICNDMKETFSFRTGARGGDGSLDDRVKGRVVGTAPTVLPALAFEAGGENNITVRPPTFGGPTRRAMQPAKVEVVPPGGRLQYASFAVPHAHVAGKFIRAEMQLDDGREVFGLTLVEKPGGGK